VPTARFNVGLSGDFVRFGIPHEVLEALFDFAGEGTRAVFIPFAFIYEKEASDHYEEGPELIALAERARVSMGSSNTFA
jgi:hypothetical protein